MTGVLEGKTAIVTGGCSGMGAATVELFLAEGAQVVVAGRRVAEGERLEAASDGRALFVRCDVTVPSDIENLFAQTKQVFGGLDILVNNAGSTGSQAPIAEVDLDDWNHDLALLLTAAMLGIKHATPVMRARGGGSIVNISSVAGLRVGPESASYSVAKAAVLHLTRMAAIELAKDGIRVNAICPGAILTPLVGTMIGLPPEQTTRALPEIGDIYVAAQPLPRTGMPADIAQAVLFLASAASSFVTGHDLVVDGGMRHEVPGNVDPSHPGSVMHQIIALRERVLGS